MKRQKDIKSRRRNHQKDRMCKELPDVDIQDLIRLKKAYDNEKCDEDILHLIYDIPEKITIQKENPNSDWIIKRQFSAQEITNLIDQRIWNFMIALIKQRRLKKLPGKKPELKPKKKTK